MGAQPNAHRLAQQVWKKAFQVRSPTRKHLKQRPGTHVKGNNGDAIHAVLCCGGYNLRLIRALLRVLLLARIDLIVRDQIGDAAPWGDAQHGGVERRASCSARTRYLCRGRDHRRDDEGLVLPVPHRSLLVLASTEARLMSMPMVMTLATPIGPSGTCRAA